MSTPPTWPPPPPPPPHGHAAAGPPAAATAPPQEAAPRRIAPAMPLIIVLLVVFCFGGVAVLGIVAAVAIPGLVRARMSGNEVSAIARMRSMASAQASWSAMHGGGFTRPGCLSAPASCGDTSDTAFLSPDMASLTPQSGYDYGFALSRSLEDGHEGDEAPPAQGALPGFAYWATPLKPGVTGIRSFCVDESGVVREYGERDEWAAPTDDAPRCPESGRPVR